MNTKPRHIAYIMDGNGRWGLRQHLSRTDGHQAGFESLKRIIKKALASQIECVSFFAFSTENWKRPSQEVNFLINLLWTSFKDQKIIQWFLDHDVRFIWNGFKENIDDKILKLIFDLEQKTKHAKAMTVQIMFNYGSRQKIVEAVNILKKENKPTDLENISQQLNPYHLPPLDLLIRTSGEKRISNYMLWELAYAEIIFNDTLWPDYDEKQFDLDLLEFSQRQRRFGGL